MGRSNFAFLSCCLFYMILVLSAKKGDAKSYNWQIKLNKTCSVGLYENDKTADDYKAFKTLVEGSIIHLYKGRNNKFVNSTLQLVNCNGTHLTVGLLTVTKDLSASDLTAFNDVFTSNINVNQSSPSIMEDVLSHDLNAAVPLVKQNPSLYAKLDGNLAGGYFCQDRSGFKSKLASTLILSDGVSRANPSRVIINNHPCGVNHEALLSNLQFYVAKANNIEQADIPLTLLAYKVVEQMIYDGTEWRLGIHLFKYLTSIELLGSAKKDPGLSDLDITYIGFGAVLGIIVLLILIVLIVGCARKRCCPDFCGGNDEKDFHVSVHDIESKEKGITNNLFQTKEASAAVVVNHDAVDNPAYEDVVDPLEITPAVQVVPLEQEPPEYYELKEMDQSAGPVSKMFSLSTACIL